MKPLKWWQKGVFYQIYPRSFANGNDDGIGDFYGMIQKLDYLQRLGIDGVWISPHFPSPQFDCGYDVADYVGVNPEYGTLATFKKFLDEAHQRNIRVILDLVLNHTSHLHPWFIESRSSRNNPKRDWYVWHDGKEGAPPNNWLSVFGGSAWEHDDLTSSYYYHFFFKEQPDLNWRNPEVKQAMWDAVRFWLDMGVDGFRLDAIATIYEDPALPNYQFERSLDDVYRMNRAAITREDQAEAMAVRRGIFGQQHDQPGIHELMRELRVVLDEYDERVLVGETDEISYYGSRNDELHMVFNFPLMRTNSITPEWVRQNQAERLAELPADAWPCNTLGNHDSRRMKSRFGDGVHDDEIARVNLALMLTLRGTPFLYNGEEIGMTDFVLSNPYEFKDLLSLWSYDLEIRLMGSTPAEAVEYAALNGRDRCRTPMQWSRETNAGFCPPGRLPWLPVNPNYASGINVGDQEDDPGSMLSFYRQMLAIRRQNPALIVGDYSVVHPDAGDYLAFVRTSEEQNCLVVLNMTDQFKKGLRFDLAATDCRMVYSSRVKGDGPVDLGAAEIGPFEVLIAAYRTTR